MRLSAPFSAAALLICLCLALPPQARAQVWVQIEARPTAAEALERARAWAGMFGQVVGFALPSGWQAIALGPYPDETEAQGALERLRAEGMIPADSFLSDGRGYGAPFWPPGAATATPPGDAPPDAAPPDPLPEAERRALQQALAAAGVYAGPIDGIMGRGTRAAIATWQDSRGLPATGTLRETERARLLAEWRAPLAALGLEETRDEAAGLALPLPMDRLTRGAAEPPFVQYDATDGSGLRVLLIGQPGDGAALRALYTALPRLGIVPAEGPRTLSETGFRIEGQAPGGLSLTRAILSGGQIAGFTLLWPAGEDPATGRRMADAMEQGLTLLPGMSGGQEPGAASGGLLDGLDPESPRRQGSGFFADDTGSVVTAAAVVAGCGRITLGALAHPAQVLATPGGELALLRPEVPLAPLAVARLASASPAAGATLHVAGFPWGDRLTRAVLGRAVLDRIGAPDGTPNRLSLTAATRPGETGGPVMDPTGAVLGMLLPLPQDPDRQWPEGLRLALDAEALGQVLEEAGLRPPRATGTAALPPETLARLAGDLTVLVTCWP